MSTLSKQLYFYSAEGLAFVRDAETGNTVLLRAAGQLLAEAGGNHSGLRATDRLGSVLRCSGLHENCALVYTPYGLDLAKARVPLLRFAGQHKDSASGCYLLGDGYRGFSPVLLRFISPDNFSPFREGGINAYAYCAGDPVNRHDTSGHMFKWLFGGTSRSSPPRSTSPQRSPPPASLQTSHKSDATSMTQADANKILDRRLDQHNRSLPFGHLPDWFGKDAPAWHRKLRSSEYFTEADLASVTNTVVTLRVHSNANPENAGLLKSTLEAMQLEADLKFSITHYERLPDKTWPLHAANRGMREDWPQG